MVHLCREYTLPRNDPRSRARDWIRKNTKIGPVLNVSVCHHEDHYSIEIQVRSLFQGRFVSLVRIENGIEKYVKETTETMEDEEYGALGKPLAKAKSRMKSTIMLTPVSVPLREGKWVEVDPGRYDHECYVISKVMTRLLRDDQNIPREIDGAIKYENIVEEFNKKKKKKFEGASEWSLNDWISILAKGGGVKKRIQYCLNPNSSRHILYFRVIQGHSGGIAIDPDLQDNVLSPKGFTKYLYHVGNVSEVHSIIRSGLIPGGQSLKQGRHSVFFTIVNPMEDENFVEETSCDLTKPRIAPYKNTGKPHQNTIYWCNWKLAQENGLLFYQTRSHAIVLYGTPPALCIEKVVCMKTKDELYQKVRLTPSVPRVVFRSNSQICLQDQQEQDARTSCDQPSGSKMPRETGRNTVDYRIPGVPLSAVE